MKSLLLLLKCKSIKHENILFVFCDEVSRGFVYILHVFLDTVEAA